MVGAGLWRRRLKNVRFGPVFRVDLHAGVARNGGFWLARFLLIRPQSGLAAWFLAVRFWGVDRAVSGGVLKPHLCVCGHSRCQHRPTIEPDRGGLVLLGSAVLMNRASAWAGQAREMALPGGVICKGPKCIVLAVSGMVIDNALRPA